MRHESMERRRPCSTLPMLVGLFYQRLGVCEHFDTHTLLMEKRFLESTRTGRASRLLDGSFPESIPTAQASRITDRLGRYTR